MSKIGRQFNSQQTHYLRKRIDYTSASGVQVLVGTLPPNAAVLRTTVSIIAAFNAASTNQIDVGTLSSASALAANASITAGSVGVTQVTPASLGGLMNASAETDLYVKYTQSGTAASAGSAIVTVEFLPDNDG